MFTIRVKEPQSIAGRTWNRAMGWGVIVPLTFLVLKLTGVVGWSWWWVLSPLWISSILFVVCIVAMAAAVVWEASRGPMVMPDARSHREPL